MSNLSYTTPEMRGINVKTINMMRIQQIMIKQQEQRILELEQQLQAPKIEQIQVVKKVSESDNMRKLIKQYGRTGRMFELILERLEHFDQTQRRKQFTDEELDLWLYIRTINLKWFIFDSQQFDGPDIRTIQLHRQRRLQDFQIKDNIFGIIYESSSIYLQLWKSNNGLGFKEQVYGSLCIDATGCTLKVTKNDDGTYNNVIDNNPEFGIKNMWKVTFVPFNPKYKHFVVFNQPWYSGKAGKVQHQLINDIKQHLKTQFIYVQAVFFDADNGWNDLKCESLEIIRSRTKNGKIYNPFELLKHIKNNKILLCGEDPLHELKRERTRIISKPLSFSYKVDDISYTPAQLKELLKLKDCDIWDTRPRHRMRDDLAQKLFSNTSLKLFEFGKTFKRHNNSVNSINYDNTGQPTILTAFSNEWLEDFIVYLAKAIEITHDYNSVRLFSLSSYSCELGFGQTQLMAKYDNSVDKLKYVAESQALLLCLEATLPQKVEPRKILEHTTTNYESHGFNVQQEEIQNMWDLSNIIMFFLTNDFKDVKNFAGRYHDQITTLYSFWSVINNQTGDDKCWKSIDEKVVQGMYVKQMFQQGAESRIQNKK
ncbi:Conserved_hypothetical protein [Hexamita inflata]|uniref:Uncharacterized protein n=1 Tax=Hexamita inflata TaxID=28002 RepID=A0ABP1IZ51_9EUKA